MNSKIIFIGNIRKCTKYTSNTEFILHYENKSIGLARLLKADEIYKKNAILLQTKNGKFIDFDNINNYLDFLKFYLLMQNQTFITNELMTFQPYYLGNLFVEFGTLRPISNVDLKENEYTFQKLKEYSRTFLKR